MQNGHFCKAKQTLLAHKCSPFHVQKDCICRLFIAHTYAHKYVKCPYHVGLQHYGHCTRKTHEFRVADQSANSSATLGDYGHANITQSVGGTVFYRTTQVALLL